jgi:hypothetical protein
MKLPAFLLTAALATLIGCARAAPPRPSADPAPAAAPAEAARGPAAPAEDKVLVAGPHPLTQKTVKLYQDMWEWYCDVELTPEQRRQFTQHFVTFWKKAEPAVTQFLLADYGATEKEWRGIRALKGGDQEIARIAVRERWMKNLRKSNYSPSRFLVSVYDEAYKVGGTKNPILVAGDPPLTQGLVGLHLATVELLLDFRLTDKQRRDYRQLVIEDWKKWGKAERARRAKNIESWAKLPNYGSYRRNVMRALNRPHFQASLKEPTARSRWLLALHESASRPGSARNPVLVEGKPPLTQLVVDRHIDHVEIMVDLSVSGGFTAPQRKMLQDYLVKDWKKMSGEDRAELLGDLKRWSGAAGGGVAEVNKFLGTQRPRMMTHLGTTQDGERSRWLLEVVNLDRRDHERNMARLKLERELDQISIDHMVTGKMSGYWQYNPRTNRYDRWVPGR